MTLVNHDTGEVLSVETAEMRASFICTDLDHAAESFETALERMREAIRERDDIVLGYRSPGDYLSDRFGGRLSRLGVDLRREVVRELTEAGMSTRAIAPVLGISKSQVATDQQVSSTGHLPQTPGPAAGGEALTDSGQTAEGESEPARPAMPVAPRPPVTGVDGKTYNPPAPRARPRRPLPDVARDAGWELTKAVERIERIADDDRYSANAEQVASHLRSHLTTAIEVCQDLLDRIDNN